MCANLPNISHTILCIYTKMYCCFNFQVCMYIFLPQLTFNESPIRLRNESDEKLYVFF